MSIQKIKFIEKEIIIITDEKGDDHWFKKEELKGPERTWFDNIIACSTSLMNYNPPK